MTRIDLPIILIAAAAGAAAGVLTAALIPKDSLESPVAAGSDDGRVARLEQQNAQLERAIAELRDGQALLAGRAERTSVRDDSAPTATAGESSAEIATASPAGAALESKLTVESALAKLTDPDAGYLERSAVWEQAIAAGLLDGLVDAMKARAEREPNNPDLRVDLGNAFIQKIFAANEMMKGYWATEADEAFDAALELDPQHWDARFTKAVALTHWPAFTGKPSLAIGEFETLISQQNAGPKQEQHAQTYFYLGNMYEATGSMAKAIETWQKGVDLFPGNSDLKQKLASAKKP